MKWILMSCGKNPGQQQASNLHADVISECPLWHADHKNYHINFADHTNTEPATHFLFLFGSCKCQAFFKPICRTLASTQQELGAKVTYKVKLSLFVIENDFHF